MPSPALTPQGAPTWQHGGAGTSTPLFPTGYAATAGDLAIVVTEVFQGGATITGPGGWKAPPNQPTQLLAVYAKKLVGADTLPPLTWVGGLKTKSTCIVLRGDVGADINTMFEVAVTRQSVSTQSIAYNGLAISNANDFLLAVGFRLKTSASDGETVNPLANFTPALAADVPNGIDIVGTVSYWQQTTATSPAASAQTTTKPDNSDTCIGYLLAIKTQVAASAGFTAGPVVNSATALPSGAYTLGFTPSASGTFYAVAIQAGTPIPSATQIKAGQDSTGAAALAAVNKSVTGADTATLGGSLTNPVYRVCCVLHTTVDSAVADLGDQYLLATSGQEFSVVTGPPPTGQLSILTGASPAAAALDVIESDQLTTGEGDALAISSTGEFSYIGSGATQTFTARVYDYSAGTWSARTTFTVNDVPPVFIGGAPYIVSVGVDMTPQDLTPAFQLAPGSTVVITATSTLPPGVSISGNAFVGHPTANGLTMVDLLAVDPAGETAAGTVPLACGQIPVPDVTALTRSVDAQFAVTAAFFNYVERDSPSNSIPLDAVISQSPPPSSSALPGSDITVTISAGLAAIVNTPLEGLQLIAKRVFVDGPDYSIVAYTNAQGSLGLSSVYADLVQPASANGYAPIVLDGTWSPNEGVSTYVHSAGASNDGFGNPCWYPTAGWGADVTGVAMVYLGIIQHFLDLRDGSGKLTTFTAAAGKKLATSISEFASS